MDLAEQALMVGELAPVLDDQWTQGFVFFCHRLICFLASCFPVVWRHSQRWSSDPTGFGASAFPVLSELLLWL